MRTRAVGFIGVGELGLPLAQRLIQSGIGVVSTKRGRSDELISAGGTVAGNGLPRDVADQADVIITCLPSPAAMDEVLSGDDGVLFAREIPTVIDCSTMALPAKARVRNTLVYRGSRFLDAPVNGTPAAVENQDALIYVSGDRDTYLEYRDLLRAMSPKVHYAGTKLNGSKMTYVAQFLTTIHAMAAVQAMAYAAGAGLKLSIVSDFIAGNPGATSAQLQAKGSLFANGDIANALGSIDAAVKSIDEVMAYARDTGAPTDLFEAAAKHLQRLVATDPH